MTLQLITANFSRPEQNRSKLLRQSCQKLGLPLLEYGLGESFMTMVEAKILRAKAAIESLEAEVICYTDAFDSFTTKESDNILDAYRAFSAPIVVQSEKGCWPDENLAAEWEVKRPVNGPWRYLCAGGWIGRRSSLINLLGEMLTRRSEWREDDQRAWTRAVLDDGKIEVDHDCEIFQSMYRGLPGEISDAGQNLVTGTWPAIFHFNGSGKGIEFYYKKLVEAK
jgi:hypothetical protein